MLRTATLFAVLTLSCSASALAQTEARSGDYGQRPWHIIGALWGGGIDGSAGIGPFSMNVSSDPGDDLGFFTQLSWHAPEGRIGFLINGYFLDASPAGTAAGVPVNTKLENSILDAAFSWNFGRPDNRIEVFGGVRHWDLDASATAPGAPSFFFGDSWNDFLLGLNIAPRLADNWWLNLRFDYSGGDSEGTWGAQIALDWAFNDSVGAFFGWKYLNTGVEKGPTVAGRFRADLDISGPLLGLGVAF